MTYDQISINGLVRFFSVGWVILPKQYLYSINTDLSGIGYYIGIILGITIAIWRSDMRPIFKCLLIMLSVFIMFFLENIFDINIIYYI